MSEQASGREFTGRKMAMVLVGGFGIVVAVNFYMASLATGGFHGIVVENSYVASQNFNDWLEDAEQSRELGWSADLSRDAEGRVTAEVSGAPQTAVISAELRRPLGEHEFASLTFAADPDGVLRSNESIAPGRWTARITIKGEGKVWTSEQPVR